MYAYSVIYIDISTYVRIYTLGIVRFSPILFLQFNGLFGPPPPFRRISGGQKIPVRINVEIDCFLTAAVAAAATSTTASSATVTAALARGGATRRDGVVLPFSCVYRFADGRFVG